MIDSCTAKKDGAGGSYTWGSATADPADFMPVSSVVVGPNVTTSAAAPAAPAAPTLVQAQPFQGNLMDDEQFPSLSGKILSQPATLGVMQVPTPSRQARKEEQEEEAGPITAPVAQAELASPTPRVALTEDKLRPGMVDSFNSSHPRNLFAPKPTTLATMVAQNAGPQMAIDWSSSGIPLEVNRSLIKAGNSSHLGLYQQASTKYVPAQYLRPATAPIQPARSNRIQAQGRPQMVKQMCAKGSRGQR